MTATATRSPLQLVTNTHYMMGDRRSTRRTSARLMEKLDAQEVNGSSYGTDNVKANGASTRAGKQSESGTAKGKRKPGTKDYDEEDDGFMFSRTRSKRPKASQGAKVPEPIAEVQQDVQKALPARKTRKKSVEPGIAQEQESAEVAPRRRSTRNSGDKDAIAPPSLDIPRKRPKEPPAAKAEKSKVEQVLQEAHDDDRMALVGGQAQTPVHNLEIATATTKIALPFADTPIMRRNKEMRKGERRSSLGMRGRRASSLIDSGTSNAVPHAEVESSEFYKHIEGSLPEPRRMRQLLTWCGTRALGDKPSFATEDSHAKLAARAIQQQLLDELSNRSELSDWFSRDDSTSKPVDLRPNPKNVANAAKIEELERQIAKLQSERKTWDNLVNPTSDPWPIPPLPKETPSPETLNPSTLSESDRKAFSAFEGVQTTTTDPVPFQNTIRARLKAITSTVEFETDKLADSVHVLSQELQASQKLGDDVLASCVKFLDLKDIGAAKRQGGERAGTRDLLRALSRTLER